MSALALEMPGMDRIRDRFLTLLDSRSTTIAQLALAAWDGESTDLINSNLEEARALLHQIAGTAGTVGYPELGIIARQCEAQIIAHLEGPYADLAICPGEIIWCIDNFVEACGNLPLHAE